MPCARLLRVLLCVLLCPVHAQGLRALRLPLLLLRGAGAEEIMRGVSLTARELPAARPPPPLQLPR
eukprot:246976-Rhodomonas_salina.1